MWSRVINKRCFSKRMLALAASPQAGLSLYRIHSPIHTSAQPGFIRFLCAAEIQAALVELIFQTCKARLSMGSFFLRTICFLLISVTWSFFPIILMVPLSNFSPVSSICLHGSVKLGGLLLRTVLLSQRDFPNCAIFIVSKRKL